MSLTVVSGFWIVPSKHTLDDYKKWFSNSLKINLPYVFFGNKESIEFVKPFRENLTTVYIEQEIQDMYCYKYYKKIKIWMLLH